MTAEDASSNISDLQSRALTELETLQDARRLEDWRVVYLGRKGKLTQTLRTLGSLPPEQRREAGQAANRAKTTLEEAYDNHLKTLEEASFATSSTKGRLDVTLPGWPVLRGGLHPTTQIVREICNAFASMGFQVVEGPEVESDEYNFEKLNIPKDHPARDMWNTLWVDYTGIQDEHSVLLRTHTSPMQARIMEKMDSKPVRVIVPGKCYRYEATDATHEWHFFQVEGLAVDKGITFADLKGTLYEFARLVFGQNRKVRFRCDYFPFVEPGAEMSIDCFLCDGQGCRVCKKTGWIEVLGAGMVHPKVLEGVGYDPSVYTGFAFGMGMERMAMLKHGIEDIRLFYSNDLRFLKQF
ncbi:MAG: phenylalanine--tRNA ligase subunit alpha [Chloroflexi bacterium]|nr:phenylalanine--tRNA ligase subunit alpha [Chloroflexota bacterium]